MYYKMPKYPNINDDKFYNRINEIYKRYKISNRRRSMESICIPRKFKLQLPQQFVSEFMNPNTPYNGVLLYMGIGAGKSCSAVRIAEKWKKHKRIVVLVPASLKGNFRNELRSLCAENNYLKPNERQELAKLDPTDEKYIEIIEKSDERIDEYYEIYSYNKFVELTNEKKINLKNALLIIDEVQNIVSEFGSWYSTIYNAIMKAPKDLRIVAMTATPMFNSANEIALTMNLLRLPENLPIGQQFNNKFIVSKQRDNGSYKHTIINLDIFKNLIKGYVSYFRGAPPYVFPKLSIRYIECIMTDNQYYAYKKILGNEDSTMGKKKKKLSQDLNVSDLTNDFYIGTRIISNIVFPQRKLGSAGLNLLTKDKILNNLQQYSVKFFEIMERIQKKSGKILFYSTFNDVGGIKSFVKILEIYGYKNYAHHGTGKHRFAIWSGSEDMVFREEIKAVYNKLSNLNGSQLKILLISPAGKEGLSLTAVRAVHILEPYWNQSRLDQIIGRASRFCSHKDLPEEKRNVKVYIYIAVHPNIEQSIDEYMHELILKKSKIIKTFENAIKESAIDCKLNKNANVYENESDINCEI